MFIILVVVVVLTLLYFYYVSGGRRQEVLLNKFPGPPKLPILGNAFQFANSIDAMGILQKLHETYGGIVYLKLGPIVHSLVFADPKSLEFVLSSTKMISKSRSYNFLHSWLGEGLLTSTGATWKSHRKIITPTFHFKILEDFVHVFNSVGNVLIEKLRKEVGRESTDVYPYITMCTLDIICETAMGVSIDAQNNSESDYVKSVKEMCRIVTERDLKLLQNWEFSYQFSRNYRSELKSLEILHGFTNKIIRQRQRELEKRGNSFEEEINEFGVKNRRKTFLDLLLDAKNADGERALTDSEIREEVDTFMFEGHDTTASAISFTLYNIANNPKAQENAVKELDAIFGNDLSKTATYQDLQDMKYLECVIKESLRLYPSVPIIGRQLEEDVEFDGKIIPKNTNIGIFIYGMHRNPQLFPDPEKFDPERFVENDKQHPFAYIPFSAGSRNCIGQKFAMLEMKATISKVLRHYELLPAIPKHELVLVSEAVLKSATGIKVMVKKRV